MANCPLPANASVEGVAVNKRAKAKRLEWRSSCQGVDSARPLQMRWTWAAKGGPERWRCFLRLLGSGHGYEKHTCKTHSYQKTVRTPRGKKTRAQRQPKSRALFAQTTESSCLFQSSHTTNSWSTVRAVRCSPRVSISHAWPHGCQNHSQSVLTHLPKQPRRRRSTRTASQPASLPSPRRVSAVQSQPASKLFNFFSTWHLHHFIIRIVQLRWLLPQFSVVGLVLRLLRHRHVSSLRFCPALQGVVSPRNVQPLFHCAWNICALQYEF